MILNRNPFELAAGAVFFLAFIGACIWMFQQLVKAGYKESSDVNQEAEK